MRNQSVINKSANNARLVAAIRLALLATSAMAAAGHAQQSGTTATQTEKGLEEVIVYGQADTYRAKDQTTATGLELSMIETPQAISVISEEFLGAMGASSAYDVLDLTPGVSQGGEGFGQERLVLRGQLLSQPRINGVNLNTDGLVDSFALDRLEVVRGPATVLYGVTGEFGGEVNQFLKRPKRDFDFEVGYEGGDFDRNRIRGDVTGAIPGTGDKLTARFVGAYEEEGIAQELVVESKNPNRLLSGALEYQFGSDSSASLYAYKQDREFDPHDGCPLAVDEQNRLYFPSVDVERWYCSDPRHSIANFTDEFVVATIKHAFESDWTLTGSAAKGKSTQELDYAYAFGPAGEFGLANTDVYLYAYGNERENDVLTASLSLGGDFDLLDRTHKFFAALEYQEQESENSRASFGLGNLNMFEDGGKGVTADGERIGEWSIDAFSNGDISKNEAFRGSVQVLVDVSPRIKALVGVLAQTTDLSSESWRVSQPTQTDEFKDTDVLGRMAFTYGLVETPGQWLQDAKAYLSYSEGVRPNVGVFDAEGIAQTDPQKMEAYELGIKTQWIEGNVDADISLFHSSVTNVPSSKFEIVDGEPTGGLSETLDGKKTFDGVEASILGEILPGWNLSLAYTYLESEVEQSLFPQKLVVANTPKHQAALVTSYEFLRGALKGFTIGTSVLRKVDSAVMDQAATFAQFGYDPNNQLLNSQTRVDFRLAYKGFTGALEGLEMAANVYNAFDEEFYHSLNGTAAFTVPMARPRTFTYEISYRFGRRQ
jgi:outer membrane receptor for ferric coprogen and ferric-rhodotorulic acid